MSAVGHMHYDHRANENNSNKSARDALGSANVWNSSGICSTDRQGLRNLGIEHNRTWAKADKVDSKFSMIKDHVTLRRTFGKYPILIPTGEEWRKK